MEQNLVLQALKKKMTAHLAVILGIIAFFYAVVCTPVYLVLASNVLYTDTLWTFLWDVLMTVCNYLFYWIAFAYLMYGFLRFGLRGEKSLIFVYSGVAVLRYFANHLASCIVNGFQSVRAFFADYFFYIVLDIGLDLLMVAVALGGCVQLLRASLPSYANDAQRADFIKISFPIASPFAWKEKAIKPILWVAAVPSAVQLISRLIYDFSYGAPTKLVDLLLMLAYYLSDILFVWIGALVISLLLNKIYLLELKLQCEWDNVE